ncbi:MAG TPA: hypothetical protein VFS00_29345 [Polyangiaceae bacterium]|nr:hypothetical protein [Polyangiaceae bacterium]
MSLAIQFGEPRAVDYAPAEPVGPRGPAEAAGGDGLARRPGADPRAAEELLGAATGTDLLFALQIYLRDAQLEAGKASLLSQQKQTETLAARVRQAIEEAQRAAEDKGFWGGVADKLATVAKVAALVAAVASVVATGGASLGPCLALAGVLVSTFAKDLSKLTGVSEEVFVAAGLALSASSLGANALAGGLGASNAADQGAREAAGAVAKGATVGQGGATVASGGARVQEGRSGAEAGRAGADEAEARARRQAAARQLDALVEALKEVQTSFANAQTTLARAMESEAASALTLANLGGRA